MASGGNAFPTREQLAKTDVLILHAQEAGNIPAVEDRANLMEFLRRGGGEVHVRGERRGQRAGQGAGGLNDAGRPQRGVRRLAGARINDMACAAVAAPAGAQTWEPTRNIELIVPAGTGGGADYHDQGDGHWIDDHIATPMSRYPDYRQSRQSFGINVLGTQTFNVGVTTVTYTVKDAAGNSATCSFTVTITDNEGNSIPAGVVGSDYESGFGLVRTTFPPRIKPMAKMTTTQISR